MENKSKIKKIVNIILNILIFFCGIILLGVMYIAIQTKILKNEPANFFGYSLFEVKTGSMAKYINQGDFIIVKLTKDVKIDDVITYKEGKENVTHRIIEVYNGTFITKGDANDSKDKIPVDESQIIGKVTKVLRGFGILRKTIFDFKVLVSLIITLFLVNYTLSSQKKINLKDYKNKIKDCFNELKVWSKLKKVIVNVKDKNLKKIKYDENKLTYEETEVIENYKRIYNLNCFSDENKSEEELQKTAVYRTIPVDASELNETFLEIANNEMKLAEYEQKEAEKARLKEEKQQAKLIKEEVVDEDPSLVNINLDLLRTQQRKKKSQVIIENIMLYKEEEINELLDLFNKEILPTYKKIFTNAYINIKYYNYYGDNEIEYAGKSMNVKVKKVLANVVKELIFDKQIVDNDEVLKLETLAETFVLINKFETAKESITELRAKKEFIRKSILLYDKTIDKDKTEKLIDLVIKIQKKYEVLIDYYLKKLETNNFVMNQNNLNTRRNILALNLEHNINFSKIYSNYIIEKTYHDGLVAEQKIVILLTLLNKQLVNDMLSENFNNKYVVYLPRTLYSKSNKLKQTFALIDDEYAKAKVIVAIKLLDLEKYHKEVKELRRQGYKFGLILDENDKVTTKYRTMINITNYIFADKNTLNVDYIEKYISKKLSNNIINENIIDKLAAEEIK